MNKTFKKAVSVLFAGVMAVSLASCDTVKLGSKIQTGHFSVSYIDSDGADQNYDVGFELYLNFAPDTIEHFKYLVKNGYYDNTVVSNISGNYLEIGAFKGVTGNKSTGELDSLAEKYLSIITKSYVDGKKFSHDTSLLRYTEDYSIRGEFSKNGVVGNQLTLSNGALVFKHDYNKDGSKSVYNTAKGVLAVTFGSGTYFSDKDKYCVIGKLVDDDEQSESESDVEYKNSVNKAKALLNYQTDAAGDVYYYFSDPDYGTAEDSTFKVNGVEISRFLKKDDEGNYYAYVKGANDAATGYLQLIDKDDDDNGTVYSDFLDFIADQSVYMQILPYNTITITSVTLD